MVELATIRKANALTRIEPFASVREDAVAHSHPRRLRFGPFELDPNSGELRGAQATVVLQWQPLQLLLMLIDRQGEMVTRNEIQKRMWGEDVIVDFDHSINQLVRKLRRALGDSAKAPTYIESLARRGYRFKVPVAVVEKTLTALATDDVRFSAGKLPAQWNDRDACEPAAPGRSSALRPRELAGAVELRRLPHRAVRCRLQSARMADHERLTPLVRTLSAQMLHECVSAATPAERLDALRQVLVLIAQVLESEPV